MSEFVHVTKLPPSEAIGARDLQRWSRRRWVGKRSFGSWRNRRGPAGRHSKLRANMASRQASCLSGGVSCLRKRLRMVSGAMASCRSRSRMSTPTAALPRSVRAGERPIEIRLPNGIVIGVSTAVEVEPLRRVLAALAGR